MRLVSLRAAKIKMTLIALMAAALSAFFWAGGCGERDLPELFDGSTGSVVSASVQPAPAAAAHDGMPKSAMAKGAEFTPEMLGLQPGGTVGELRFNWYSNLGDSLSQTFVRVFEGDALVASATGTSGLTSESYQYHKADVSGLRPNTEYAYWVSNDGVNWSYEYEYKSPPASGPFRFAAVSDVQFDGSKSDHGLWKFLARKIAEEGASLIVNAGDHVEYCSNSGTGGNAGGGEKSYNMYFGPEELRSIPTAPVMGNHDMCYNFEYHFNLPNVVNNKTQSSSQSGGNYNYSNYYFLSNKVLFVGLNTSPTPTSVDNAKGYVADYREAVKAAKDAHKNKYDFLVVTHHKSTTSISAYGHAFDSDVGYYVAAGFQELMTEEGVDVVFAGHDHMYVRSNFMKDNNLSEDGAGTLYLTLKPGGQTRDYNSSNNKPVDDLGFNRTLTNYNGSINLTQKVNAYPFLQRFYNQRGGVDYYLPISYGGIFSRYDATHPGYAIIDVAYGRMKITVYEQDGTKADEFELARKPIGITASGRLSKL